jgi:preprotein translocase subunit YajC
MDLTLIIASVIGLIVFFFLIYFAIRSGTSELNEKIDLLLKLKIEEMKKRGMTGEVTKVQDGIIEMKRLKKLKSQGYLTTQQLEEKEKQIFS